LGGIYLLIPTVGVVQTILKVEDGRSHFMENPLVMKILAMNLFLIGLYVVFSTKNILNTNIT
jgi:hydrogenase-4 membrane subunit HyfE